MNDKAVNVAGRDIHLAVLLLPFVHYRGLVGVKKAMKLFSTEPRYS
jgi:hypothetical protein